MLAAGTDRGRQFSILSVFALGILLFGPGACSVSKLGRDLERASDSYAYLKISLPSANAAGGEFLLALYRNGPEGLELLSTRTPNPGQSAVFLLPLASYTVVAFEDVNADFIYQRGEPAQILRNPTLNTDATLDPDIYVFDQLVVESLSLSEAVVLPFPVDLSLQSVSQQIDRVQTNFLALTDWDDPRFASKSVQQGLWQPLSFAEQTGFGLYRLEPLDLTRQQVLYVHGINGSPVQFRPMVEAMGDCCQAIFFQYPSGFPLEKTAHILQTSINEVLKRYPGMRLSLVAHSMGGLVLRGAIISSDEDTIANVNPMITLSTPWLGHEAASLGVEWSPAVAPVWRSMVPNSHYQQAIFSRSLPDYVDHYMGFSYARSRNGDSRGDDGVVTVKSQLGPQAQLEARAVFGINDDHNGILSNPCTLALVRRTINPGGADSAVRETCLKPQQSGADSW